MGELRPFEDDPKSRRRYEENGFSDFALFIGYGFVGDGFCGG